MKSVELAEATGALADYARAADETLVVTRRGKPVAAVVPLRGVDLESLAVSTSPVFIDIVERARARFKETGGVSLEEIKRRWERPGPQPRRSTRDPVAKSSRPSRRSR